ncbi:MAG: IS21-like element helper ATPase IstB [Desulfobacterales bacterium]
MNNHATIEKMSQMKLPGMQRIFKALLETGSSDMTTDEVIGSMVDAEWDERYNRKLSRLLNAAKFRYQASLEQIDFSSQRRINKNDLLRLAACDWIRKGDSLIVTGATGVGKSFIACALGNQACKEGFTVLYFNCLKLFSQLKFAKADGSYFKEMNKLRKQDLLILDDFGLEPPDAQSRLILLEILEDRHGRKSTMITSQLPENKWHDFIGEPTIADAICDRIIHKSYKIILKGESMRKNNVNS